MNIKDTLFKRWRCFDGDGANDFLQLWILDLGQAPEDVLGFIAHDLEVEPQGLKDVYGGCPSLYLELPNGEDTFFLINQVANELHSRGAMVEVKRARQSVSGLSSAT